MRYVGGKEKISKDLANFLNPIARKCKAYWEPFVGGLSVISKIVHPKRFGTDIHPVINTYIEWQKGWRPDLEECTERMYRAIRHAPDTDPLKHFMGFGCAYCGVYFHGYARDNSKYYSYNSLERKMNTCKDVVFKQGSYDTFGIPENFCIYADPPYADTSHFDKTGKFNSIEFWDWCIKVSEKNILLISEYSTPYPEIFIPVWERKKRMTIRQDYDDVQEEERNRTEKLYIHKNSI